MAEVEEIIEPISHLEKVIAQYSGGGGVSSEVLDGITSQINDIVNKGFGLQNFIKKLQSGEINKITMFGDSITEGVGVTGHLSPPKNTGTKIFDDGKGVVFYEADKVERSFANYFRDYLTEFFPSISYLNKGIAGKSAKWCDNNKEYLVGDEDVCFVMLGANDRWDSNSSTEFKNHLTSFIRYLKTKSNQIILMSSNPSIAEYSTPNPAYHFNMNTVDMIVNQVANEENIPYISFYREMLNYVIKSGVGLNLLVQTDGSHPVNAGHKLMWQILELKLGLVDNPMNFTESFKKSLFQYEKLPALNFDTKPTDDIIKDDTFVNYFTGLTTNEASGLPTGKPGILYFNKAGNDLYCYEIFVCRDDNTEYKRNWNGTNKKWSKWVIKAQYLEMPYNRNAFSRLATDYNIGITTDLVGDDFTDNPLSSEKGRGILETHIVYQNIDWSYQILESLKTNKRLKRIWNSNNSTWGDWIE